MPHMVEEETQGGTG